MSKQPLRIGVIGVDGRGKLSRCWHQPDREARLVAGVDVNPDYLETFRKEIDPEPFVTADYKEMLAREDVDAVGVFSPDFCHEEHAVAALKAGKHVFCEKPLAITTEGCDRILAAWKDSGKKLMVGFNMRYAPLYRVMKQIADSGELGDIKAVWMRHFVGHGSDWYFHDWHAKRENTTGLMLQKASHDIDMIQWITGRYTRRVVGMGALTYFGGHMPNDLTCPECARKDVCPDVQPPENPRQQCAFREEVDVEDNNSIIMDMEGGLIATYVQCHYTPDAGRNYVFIGTHGRMECPSGEDRVLVYKRGSVDVTDFADRTHDIKPTAGGHGGADPVIAKDFLDMVLRDKEPVATPLAGRMSVAVACAATESIRQGGVPIDIPSIN